MKNVDKNDEDQRNGIEGMKNQNENETKNLNKNDGYQMSSLAGSNVHNVLPRLYLK